MISKPARARLLSMFGLLLAASLPATAANAGRASRIDDWTTLCAVGPSVVGDGSIEVALAAFAAIDPFSPVGCTENIDPSSPIALPVNFYGTLYDTLFINENGTVTFGAGSGATATTNLLNFGTPVIAAFLADVDAAQSLLINYGWNSLSDQFAITFAVSNANGDGPNVFQLLFTDDSGLTGTDGDFTLEMNYDRILWDNGGATTGFSNGAGEGYVFPGAGESGAYFGETLDDFEPEASLCPVATGLACGAFGLTAFDVDFDGKPLTGRYRFIFRDGTPVALPDGDDINVPAPPMLLLFGLGAAALAVRCRRAGQ